MTQQHQLDCIRVGLQVVKDLYAELFMLLERSVAEDPLTEQIGGLDMAIARLIPEIEARMRDFRGALAQARAGCGLDAPTSSDVADFEDKLRAGLTIMAGRVRQRTEELTLEREQLKERLATLNHKRQGARGYRPFLRDRTVLDSSV